jgi:lysophospholipase L1-like esterase
MVLSNRLPAIAIASAVACLSAGYVYGLSVRTLSHIGRWTSVKTTIQMWLCDADRYVRQTQALATGSLNLGAWHGYQEVLTEGQYRPTSYSFRFRLEPNTYLVTLFNGDEGAYRFVRLSADPEFPSAYGVADGNGRFFRKLPMANAAVTSGTWHTGQIDFSDRGYAVRIDGRSVAAVTDDIHDSQRIGFRGSLAPVYVDDIVIRNGKTVLFAEHFDNPLDTVLGFFGMAVCLTLLYGGIWIMTVRTRKSGRGSLYVLVAATTAGVCSLIVAAAAPVYYSRYPTVAGLAEQPQPKGALSHDVSQSVEQYRRIHPPVRPFIIEMAGGSQTHGTGASDADHTFVSIIGRKLAETYPDRHPEVINAGMEGFNAQELLDSYRAHWTAYKPDVLVINTSSNDSFWEVGLDEFSHSIEDFLRLNASASVKTVFVLEPQSPENDRTRLDRYHAVLKQLGEKYDVPVIDLGAYLDRYRDDGFLWWDFVHMTNYGQELVATYLTQRLPEILGWR